MVWGWGFLESVFMLANLVYADAKVFLLEGFFNRNIFSWYFSGLVCLPDSPNRCLKWAKDCFFALQHIIQIQPFYMNLVCLVSMQKDSHSASPWHTMVNWVPCSPRLNCGGSLSRLEPQRCSAQAHHCVDMHWCSPIQPPAALQVGPL